MAPKKQSAAAKVAAAAKETAAEKKLAKEAEKARKEEEEKEEGMKQRNALCNFVTQGKKADDGTPLKRAFDEYKELPLHSEQKMKIALNWKADKSCSWLNSFIETHSTKKSTTTSRGSGYRTSFWIAKELGMPHDSDIFKAVLQGYGKYGPEVWNENDPAEKPFKDAGLDAYMYAEKSLEVNQKVDGHDESFNSVSNAKKAKMAIADVVNQPGSSSNAQTVQINHELWHSCNALCKDIESNLGLYTSRTQEMKDLQVKYLNLQVSEALKADVDGRMEFMNKGLKEISDMEIKSLQFVSTFSGFEKDNDEGLAVFKESMLEHLTVAGNLHDAVCQRIKKNAAWLDAM